MNSYILVLLLYSLLLKSCLVLYIIYWKLDHAGDETQSMQSMMLMTHHNLNFRLYQRSTWATVTKRVLPSYSEGKCYYRKYLYYLELKNCQLFLKYKDGKSTRTTT